MLVPQPQCFAARHQDFETLGLLQQTGHQRRRCEEVFEVIQQQQGLAIAKMDAQLLIRRPSRHLRDSKGTGDGWRDEPRVGKRRKLDQEYAVGKVVTQRTGELQTRRVLPVPPAPVSVTSPTSGAPQQRRHRREFARAAQQGLALHRQVVWVPCAADGHVVPNRFGG